MTEGGIRLSNSKASFNISRFLPSGSNHRPAYRCHCEAPDQESSIPINLLRPGDDLIDVVHAENLVINDALNEIEEAPPEQQSANEHLIGPVKMASVSRLPQGK